MASQASNVVRPSDAELLQAQADLWRVSLSYLTPMSLRCAVELGIPTAIHRHGGAASPADLIAALSLPSTKLPFLRRLLRLLAVAGVFAVDKTTAEERYCINAVSYLLVDGIPDEVHINHTSLVLTCTSTRYLEAALGLAEWFKKDVVTPPFEELHGAALFHESLESLDPDIVVQPGRPARHGHGHERARHGEARHYAARQPAVPCLIVPACRDGSPSTALWLVRRAVPCRRARPPPGHTVPLGQLAARHAVVVIVSVACAHEGVPSGVPQQPTPHRRRRRTGAARRAAVLARPELLLAAPPSSRGRSCCSPRRRRCAAGAARRVIVVVRPTPVRAPPPSSVLRPASAAAVVRPAPGRASLPWSAPRPRALPSGLVEKMNNGMNGLAVSCRMQAR